MLILKKAFRVRLAAWPLAGVACLAAVLAIAGGQGSRPVVEPVAIPAATSALAAKSPLIGIAWAGKRLVTVGQRGHILLSDDSGATWRQARVPVSADLVAVDFPSPGTGWAVGHDGVVLRSDDGGESWALVMEGRRVAGLLMDYYRAPERAGQTQYQVALEESERFVGEEGARPFLDVWFADERNGFIVGAWGLILRTTDGGTTWEPWLHRVDNPNLAHLYAIRPAASSVWIAGEQGLLLRLDEGEEDFATVESPSTGSLFGVLGIPGGVLAYGLLGKAVVSHDGGRSWLPSAGLGAASLTGAAVLPDGGVAMVDGGAGIWLSRDGGKTFTQVPSEHPTAFAGVAADGPYLHLVGLNGVQRQAALP